MWNKLDCVDFSLAPCFSHAGIHQTAECTSIWHLFRNDTESACLNLVEDNLRNQRIFTSLSQHKSCDIVNFFHCQIESALAPCSSAKLRTGPKCPVALSYLPMFGLVWSFCFGNHVKSIPDVRRNSMMRCLDHWVALRRMNGFLLNCQIIFLWQPLTKQESRVIGF